MQTQYLLQLWKFNDTTLLKEITFYADHPLQAAQIAGQLTPFGTRSSYEINETDKRKEEARQEETQETKQEVQDEGQKEEEIELRKKQQEMRKEVKEEIESWTVTKEAQELAYKQLEQSQGGNGKLVEQNK